jgi:C1A family cysteine protease
MRALGYIHDTPDKRDVPLRALAIGAAPSSASLRKHVVSVLDQGNLGSCVAQAVTQAVRTFQHSEAKDVELASRLAAYWYSRNQHGDADVDSGTYIRLCIKANNVVGRPPESAWPYDIARFRDKPPPDVMMQAYDARAAKYFRITETGILREDAIRRAVAAGFPVVFGTDVGNSFLSFAGGRIIRPPTSEPIAGGHAMCIVGYETDHALVVNSWGEDWGEDGFARFDWSYFSWSRTNDLWAIAL